MSRSHENHLKGFANKPFRFRVLAALLIVASPGTLLAQTPAPPTPTLAHLSRAVESMVEWVSPGVVQILVSGFVPGSGIVQDSGDLLSRHRSSGSGVILDEAGYIVTNAHVVRGARRIQVLVPGPKEDQTGKRSILKPAGKLTAGKVIGIDRETDLAIIKVSVNYKLPSLKLGDSDALRKGELVFALGSPFGLTNSVSMGIVSSVARQLRPEDPMVYIQTDATINPGNSGGPLVNTLGEVIGVNTLIFSRSGGSQGVGFAAPSNIVRNIYSQIRIRGSVRRGSIGVSAQTITPLLARSLNLPQDWGVVLGDVLPSGTGNRAALRIGDIILTLNRKPMENARQFNVNLYGSPIAEEIELEVLRESQTVTIKVRVEERPGRSTPFQSLVSPEKNLVASLGILGMNYNSHTKGLLPKLRRNYGVIVAALAADAPYREHGVLPGDVIYALNQKTVRNLKDLREELATLRIYDAVVLQIERDGLLMFVVFEHE